LRRPASGSDDWNLLSRSDSRSDDWNLLRRSASGSDNWNRFLKLARLLRLCGISIIKIYK
jgi:hypothetical protein